MIIRNILGTNVNMELSMDEAVALIDDKLQQSDHFQICTTNPEFILEAKKDAAFQTIINNSYLSLPDGSGVIFAHEYNKRIEKIDRNFLFPVKAFFAGLSLVAKIGDSTKDAPIYGTDLVNELLVLAEQKGYTVGFLGGWPKDYMGKPLAGDYNIAKEAEVLLKKKHPNLKVVFADSTVSHKEEQDSEVVSRIALALSQNDLQILDILFVAFGNPKQEKWISRNIAKIPAKLGVGVGGTFDDIAGYTAQPGEFYSKYNLRWLFRLIHQPWRIKRILKATLLFPLLVFIDTLKIQ